MRTTAWCLAFAFTACGGTPTPIPAATTPAAPSATNGNEPVDLRAAACVGPSDARSFAIYLHGMDGETPSEQEMKNRKVLVALAQRLSLRVALPRAKMACPNQAGSICWGWSFNDAEVAESASIVRAAASSCFADHPVTVVGFSNGGYLLTKLIRSCSLKRELPTATRVITVGAGMIKGTIESEPKLAGCGELTMLVGSKDEFNFDPTGNLVRQLRARSANVREIQFDGGHLLNDAALGDVLFAR